MAVYPAGFETDDIEEMEENEDIDSPISSVSSFSIRSKPRKWRTSRNAVLVFLHFLDILGFDLTETLGVCVGKKIGPLCIPPCRPRSQCPNKVMSHKLQKILENCTDSTNSKSAHILSDFIRFWKIVQIPNYSKLF